MKHRMWTLALAGALSIPLTLAGMAGVAHAEDIGFARAEQIALAQVPGTVIDIEREHERGREAIEVEIRTAEGVEFEVTIDAHDGTVLSVARDD